MEKVTLFLFASLSWATVTAQVYVNNPSFEGNAIPPGWEACGSLANYNTGASDGTNYVEVSTDDWSGNGNPADIYIAQKLICPTTPGSTIDFTIDLKTGDTTGLGNNFDNSGFLEIYCSPDVCTPGTLLWTSPRINHYNWQTYAVSFTAPATCDYLLFKALCIGCNGNFFGGGGSRVQLDNIVSSATVCAPTVTLDSNLVCSGECLDLIPVVVGGALPLTYAWSDGLGSGTSANVCPTSDGPYTVTVTDNLGRTSSASGHVTIDTDRTVVNRWSAINKTVKLLTEPTSSTPPTPRFPFRMR